MIHSIQSEIQAFNIALWFSIQTRVNTQPGRRWVLDRLKLSKYSFLIPNLGWLGIHKLPDISMILSRIPNTQPNGYSKMAGYSLIWRFSKPKLSADWIFTCRWMLSTQYIDGWRLQIGWVFAYFIAIKYPCPSWLGTNTWQDIIVLVFQIPSQLGNMLLINQSWNKALL